ncbi:MAG: Dabb family protein [Solobacterium sp.]|nr:Dabb family protein [Solobacterium sp.]
MIKTKKWRSSDMVKHIILWTLKAELSEEEKTAAKAAFKEGLEGLAGKIEGLEEIHVYTEGFSSSNTDVMLESVHTGRDALNLYANHPLHVAVKDNVIVPKVSGRYAFDFEF